MRIGQEDRNVRRREGMPDEAPRDPERAGVSEEEVDVEIEAEIRKGLGI